jgi:hypothetical protein
MGAVGGGGGGGGEREMMMYTNDTYGLEDHIEVGNSPHFHMY